MTLKLAVLISGRGTNLAAILRSIEEGSCDAEVALVAADRAQAAGIELAATRGIATAVVPPRAFPNRDAWSASLAETVSRVEPDVVVLAGFMRLLGPAFIHRFEHRIINVHPSLLPAFPGATGPEQALAAGVRLTGCTVHVVDTGMDSGAIIAQAAVPIMPDDDVTALHARIQGVEHVLLPRVIAAIAVGQIELGPRPHVATPPDAGGALLSLPEAADSCR